MQQDQYQTTIRPRGVGYGRVWLGAQSFHAIVLRALVMNYFPIPLHLCRRNC